MSTADDALIEAEQRYPANRMVDDPHGETGYAQSDPYGDNEEAAYHFIAGAVWQSSRIILLLEGLTAYDKDGDLILAESWPELRTQIEGEQA